MTRDGVSLVPALSPVYWVRTCLAVGSPTQRRWCKESTARKHRRSARQELHTMIFEGAADEPESDSFSLYDLS
jgi:hypothetical protein